MIYTKRGLVRVQEWGGEKKRERMGFSCKGGVWIVCDIERDI